MSKLTTLMSVGAVALTLGASPAWAQHAGKSDQAPGRLRQVTADEARALMAGMERFLDQRSSDLLPVRHANGALSIDLQDRFQSVSVARLRNDGTVDTQCVTTPGEARAYLGLPASTPAKRIAPVVMLEEK